jgi:hypothetical protein
MMNPGEHPVLNSLPPQSVASKKTGVWFAALLGLAMFALPAQAQICPGFNIHAQFQLQIQMQRLQQQQMHQQLQQQVLQQRLQQAIMQQALRHQQQQQLLLVRQAAQQRPVKPVAVMLPKTQTDWLVQQRRMIQLERVAEMQRMAQAHQITMHKQHQAMVPIPRTPGLGQGVKTTVPIHHWSTTTTRRDATDHDHSTTLTRRNTIDVLALRQKQTIAWQKIRLNIPSWQRTNALARQPILHQPRMNAGSNRQTPILHRPASEVAKGPTRPTAIDRPAARVRMTLAISCGRCHQNRTPSLPHPSEIPLTRPLVAQPRPQPLLRDMNLPDPAPLPVLLRNNAPRPMLPRFNVPMVIDPPILPAPAMPTLLQPMMQMPRPIPTLRREDETPVALGPSGPTEMPLLQAPELPVLRRVNESEMPRLVESVRRVQPERRTEIVLTKQQEKPWKSAPTLEALLQPPLLPSGATVPNTAAATPAQVIEEMVEVGLFDKLQQAPPLPSPPRSPLGSL